MRICQLKTQQQGQDIRLLQITDTHLFADPARELIGFNTANSFQTVVDQIQQNKVEFDAVIATGDLSQDQTTESYLRFAKTIEKWHQPCYYLPGNHDEPAVMVETLESQQIQHCELVLLGDKWMAIMLDSHVRGEPSGYLSSEQLSKIDDILSRYPNRFAAVLLHHHPLDIGCDWLDQHQLMNKTEFWQKIALYPNVKTVLFGHVHQDVDRMVQTCRAISSPSTCFQFLPSSYDFMLDSLNPGWREITLHANGEISTQVKRIISNDFLPDTDVSGY